MNFSKSCLYESNVKILKEVMIGGYKYTVKEKETIIYDPNNSLCVKFGSIEGKIYKVEGYKVNVIVSSIDEVEMLLDNIRYLNKMKTLSNTSIETKIDRYDN